MVSVVHGTGLGQASRVPFGVAVAGIAGIATGLAEVGRVPELRISLKPSRVTGVTVPPLIAPPPDPGGLEDRLAVDLSGDHALADLVPVQELGFHVAVGVEGFCLLMADTAPASAPAETGTFLRWPREPMLPEPP